VRTELVSAIDAELAKLEGLLGPDLEAFNNQVASHEIPAIAVQ